MGCMRQRREERRDPRRAGITVRFEAARGGVVRIAEERVGDRVAVESWTATPV